jgi:hypothetical protein
MILRGFLFDFYGFTSALVAPMELRSMHGACEAGKLKLDVS